MYRGIFRIPKVSEFDLNSGYFDISFVDKDPVIRYYVPRSVPRKGIRSVFRKMYEKSEPLRINFQYSEMYPMPKIGFLDVSVPTVFKNMYKLVMYASQEGSIKRFGYGPVRKLNRRGNDIASRKGERHVNRIETNAREILESQTFRENLEPSLKRNGIRKFSFKESMRKYLEL